MEGADNTEEERYSPGERYGRVYQINYARCILCGLCIEACPTRALTMTNEFELANTTRESLIYTKDELLAGLQEGMVDSPHAIYPGMDEQDYYRGVVTEAAGTVRQTAVSKGENDKSDEDPIESARAADARHDKGWTRERAGRSHHHLHRRGHPVLDPGHRRRDRRALHGPDEEGRAQRALLAGTMIILAVFYLANGAYFLGIVQIIVYTGAIMMLFLFVVMLVGVTAADSLKETLKGQRWLAAGCALGFGILLIAGIGNASSLHVQRARRGQRPARRQRRGTRQPHLHQVRLRLRDHRRPADHGDGRRDGAHAPRAHRTGQDPAGAGRAARARGQAPPPLPAPGVYARHNAVDIPGLLPDGTPSELTVMQTLRKRGQIRDVSQESLADLRALEQRSGSGSDVRTRTP